MRFAKLIDVDDPREPGQLLAELHDSEAREDADAPFQLVLKTISPYGVTMTLAYGYSDERKRDEEFARLTPEELTAHFTQMQETLRIH